MRGVLSLVERGWKGARECSLQLANLGIRVDHLIKGRLGAVRGLIAPNQSIRLIDIERQLYPLALGWWLFFGALTRRIRWVLCDNERTLKRVEPWSRRLGLEALLIREEESGYALIAEGKIKRLQEVFKL